MPSRSTSTCMLLGLLILWWSAACPVAQTQGGQGTPQAEIELTKLSPPIYPVIARQAGIRGHVVLMLGIRPNGSVASAIVVSGPELLKKSALESAQKSEYECRNCRDEQTWYRLVYSFELDPKDCAEEAEISKNSQKKRTYPIVIKSRDEVVLSEEVIAGCDPVTRISQYKVRSWKCLYLWKCTSPPITYSY
jgi:hypothetical protein